MTLFELMGKIVINGSEASEEIDKVKNKAKEMADTVGGKVKSAGDNISKVGKALAPVSLAVGGVLTASVKGASDFQDSMAKVSTLVDTSKVDIDALSQSFLDLSNETGKSATELAEAGYQALSASVPVEKLGEFTKTATDLAKVGFTDTSTAVDVLTTAINAYGLETEDAEGLATKLVKTQNLGKTTVDELASSMGKIIPTASGMNVGIDNLTAGYVTLTKQGIATAESTTYMNSMLNELGDSGSKTGGILQEETGKSFQELMDDGWSLGDVLEVLKDHADTTGTNFNELWSSAEAGKASMAIVNSGVDEFNDTVDTMKENTDELSEGLEKLNTPSAKAQKSMNQLKNSGIQLGTSFLSALAPVIETVTNGITMLTEGFNSLPAPVQGVIGVIMAIVAVAAPLLMLIGGLVSSVGTIITTLPALAGVMGTVTGGLSGLAGAFSFLAGPVGIIIAVVGALIAVFVHLWNTNEEFRNNVIALWEGIKETLSNIWENIKNGVSEAWETIKNIVTVAVMLIAEIFETLVDLWLLPFRFVWENCKDTILEAWDFIKEKVSSGISAVHDFLSDKLTAIHDFFSEKWTAISDFTSEILSKIYDFFSEKWSAISDFVSEITEGIRNTIDEKISSARDILSGVLDAIGTKFTDIWEGAKNTVSNAIDFIKGLFDFEWHLPDISLPHFSISGGFSLNPPSVPDISIDWYDKAMKSPFMFSDPTLFGFNPMSGNARVAGETGDEMLYGHQSLMNDIKDAVRSETGSIGETITALFEKLFRILEMYFPEFAGDIVMDGETVAKRLAPKIDEELGKIYKQKGRS